MPNSAANVVQEYLYLIYTTTDDSNALTDIEEMQTKKSKIVTPLHQFAWMVSKTGSS